MKYPRERVKTHDSQFRPGSSQLQLKVNPYHELTCNTAVTVTRQHKRTNRYQESLKSLKCTHPRTTVSHHSTALNPTIIRQLTEPARSLYLITILLPVSAECYRTLRNSITERPLTCSFLKPQTPVTCLFTKLAETFKIPAL